MGAARGWAALRRVAGRPAAVSLRVSADHGEMLTKTLPCVEVSPGHDWSLLDKTDGVATGSDDPHNALSPSVSGIVFDKSLRFRVANRKLVHEPFDHSAFSSAIVRDSQSGHIGTPASRLQAEQFCSSLWMPWAGSGYLPGAAVSPGAGWQAFPDTFTDPSVTAWAPL